MRNSRIFAPTLTQEDISFKLAPKINATGRMYHPDIALGLLKEKDNTTADKIVKHVASCNDERKALQKKIEKMVADKIKGDKGLEDKMVEISRNVLTQLFKALWTKRSFWKSGLSNKAS